jgi:carbonic anhydrase
VSQLDLSGAAYSRRAFNRRALRWLTAGGALVGLACASGVSEEEFTALKGDVDKLKKGEGSATAAEHGATTKATAKASAKSTTAAKDAHGAASTPHWTYAGKGGPSEWAGLAPENAVCGSGSTQSPIDIAYTQPGAGGRTVFKWQPTATLEVVNNGHTIQANVKDGSAIDIDGVSYKLVQFHFHGPSEHTIDGKQFALETHFVHKSEKGDLAVVGVLHGAGEENGALAPIWAALPKSTEEKQQLASFDLLSVLPRERRLFRYAGSLTTPPCSEGVRWQVMQTPTSISPAQVQAFLGLFKGGNARPVQPLKARDVVKEAA